jgi:hypothetical protein
VAALEGETKGNSRRVEACTTFHFLFVVLDVPKDNPDFLSAAVRACVGPFFPLKLNFIDGQF